MHKEAEEIKKEEKMEQYEARLDAMGIAGKLKERLMDGLQYTGRGSVTLTDLKVHTLLADKMLTRGYGITVLQGPGGVGKTQLLASIVASMSRGESTTLGALAEPGKPLTSLIFASDGGGSTQYERALLQRNADMEKVSVISSFCIGMPRSLDDAIIEKYLEILTPDLVIFDSLTSFSRGKMKDRDDIEALTWLDDLAVKYSCAIVVVNHYTKTSIWAGSQGILDASREMYSLGPVYGHPGTLYLAPEKCSHKPSEEIRLRWFRQYSTPAGPELAEIPVPVEHQRDEARTAAYWADYAERAKAREGKAEKQPGDAEASQKSKATAVILALLSIATKPMPKTQITLAARAAGIRDKTVNAAIQDLVKASMICRVDHPTDSRASCFVMAATAEDAA